MHIGLGISTKDIKSLFIYCKSHYDGTLKIKPYEIERNELYTDDTTYDYVIVGDYIVSDLTLLKAIYTLGKHSSNRELYFDYLEVLHPTYSYH